MRRLAPLGLDGTWHDGFGLPIGMLDQCARCRCSAAAAMLAAISRDGCVTPRDIGVARAAGLDGQLLKWPWHCVARFGHP